LLAGTLGAERWIPAFAGMAGEEGWEEEKKEKGERSLS
jgi:hypothetical protein